MPKTIELRLSEGCDVADAVLYLQKDGTTWRLWIEKNRKELTPIYTIRFGDLSDFLLQLQGRY